METHKFRKTIKLLIMKAEQEEMERIKQLHHTGIYHSPKTPTKNLSKTLLR